MDNGVIYEYRCKICKLAEDDAELFKELHAYVLDAGMSHSRAMGIINGKIEKEYQYLSKLNAQNMSTHFSTHVSIVDRVNTELSKVAGTSLSTVSTNANMAVEDMIRRKVGNEVSDYLNLDHLRTQITDKLAMIDTAINTRYEASDGKSVDLEYISTYARLAGEIRGCINDLNKIRQSRQLMSTVIKSLLERYTFDVAKQITREYDSVQKDLIKLGLDEGDAVRVVQGLKVSAAQIVAQTARAAVEDVLKTYKLQ
jgi:hypothetical protein